MAKTIGLNITLNGVQTAVSSIKELETELTKARERLGGLAIGSDEFKKLTTEIQRADSQLKNLKKSAEGLESVQQAEAFAKVAAGITTSFAAAQAAVQLFGAENEDVTKAIVKAQQVLTIALAARGAAEAALNIKIVANIVAQRAATAATAATTTATRTLYATIAANPIGALVAVLGLAVTAMFAFGSETEDTADKQDELQKALDRTNRELDFQISLLEKSGGTAVQIAEARLKKEKELDEQLTAAYIQAQTRNRLSEETQNLRQQVTEQRRKVELAGKDVEIAKQKELDDATKKSADAAKQRSDERTKQLEEEKRIAIDAFNAQIEALKELRRQLNAEVPEPKVITTLKETLEILKGFSGQIVEKPFSTLLQEFKDLKPPVDVAVQELDRFGVEFLKIRKQLSDAAQKGDFESVATGILNTFGTLKESGEITQVAFNALIDIVDSYRSIAEIRAEDNIFSSNILSTYYGKLKQELVATGDIVLKIGEDGAITTEKLTVKAGQALTEFNAYEESLFDALVKRYSESEEYAKLDEDTRTELAEKRALERLKILKEESLEIIKQEQNIIRFRKEAEDLQLERTKNNTTALLGFLKQNADGIIKELSDIYEGDLDAVAAAFDQLVQNELAGTDLTEEQLAAREKLYEEFYKKLDEKRKEDTDKEKQKTQEILNNVGAFASELGKLNGVLRGFYQDSLDRLEAENNAVLESIVGTSEEANQKRLEQEQIYNEQKKQLDKKAALTDLRLTLLQAIADGAAAVVNAAKTPFLIPIVAAVNAAQIALIATQINTTRSLQRGGLLGGGGLLQGPSHEQGGIRLAQAGVVAEGGEAVINRVGSVMYRDLLDQINQQSGGSPLVVSNFDDSRILEALAKQRKEPIRAYVQEQEITNKQAISRRLEQLSSL